MSTTSQFFITGYDYAGKSYVTNDVVSDVVIYRMYDGGSALSTVLNISYTQSTGIWFQGPGGGNPAKLNSVDSYATATDSIADAETIYGYNNEGAPRMSFPSPWYQAPTPPNTNSYSDAFVSYLVDDNELRVYIPLDKPSTLHPNPDPAGRDLYYQLRKISGSSDFRRIDHTQGTATNETIVPPSAGIYQLEKVQSNPTEYTTYDTAEVSQAQLDFYAANNPPDDDPPDDDPPENDPPSTPVFIRGSARRGNLNFW